MGQANGFHSFKKSLNSKFNILKAQSNGIQFQEDFLHRINSNMKFSNALTLLIFFLLISLLVFRTNKDAVKILPGFPEANNEEAESEPLALEFYKRLYANPLTGELGRPSAGVQQYWLKMIESQKLKTRGPEDDINWIEVGPTNVGGRTRAIAMDSQNPNRLIAGGVRGGLWITENQGDRWNHVNGITGNESVTCIVQHPNDPNRWYASTGEYIGSGANFFGGGLLYSEDNGQNWESQHYAYQFDSLVNDYTYQAMAEFPVSSAPPWTGTEGYPFQYASRIKVHPDANSIFVATNGWGILRSTDGLQSFTHILPPNPPRYSRQPLPVDTSTTLMLRFDGNLNGASGIKPQDSSEIDFQEGLFGQGAYLDTFDVLQYASQGVINSREGTIEFWLKPVWNGDNNQEHLLLEFGDFPFAMSFRRINNAIEFLYARGDGEDWYVVNSGTADWKAGDWHYIAFTWGPAAISLYLDGRLASTAPVESLPQIEKDLFQFGVPWGDGVGGVLDEFRISNRARMADEINQSFQFGTLNGYVVNYPSIRPDFSDLSIGPDGDLLACLSGHRNAGSGVYQSLDNGNTWNDITPDDWPEFVERGIVEHAPSNPNIAYLLLLRPEEKMSFYKFDLEHEKFENRTQNLPKEGVYPGNYYLVMNVKPDDENFVVIGGVNLFRSMDAFANPVDDPTIHYIQNQMHVDNHLVYFNPTNPKEAWAVNDGGIYFSEDITRLSGSYDNVRWQVKNNNYNVTQFYTVGQSSDPLDHRVVGGAQDNGYLQVYPPDPLSTGIAFGENFGSDGAYVYVTKDFTYMSFQLGETFRLNAGPDGNASWENGWILISPSGEPDRDFIHQWAVDPVDENTMYYPIGNKVYRVDDIELTPINTAYGIENFDLISDGDQNHHDRITALAVTSEPAHTLLFASSGEIPIIKKVKNAHTDDYTVEDVSIHNATVPGTYTRCIAPNPADGDEWLVVMTNFDVPGLYHTTNGGQTYQLVEGNLAGTEELPGPSMEWAEILNYNGLKYYLLATQIGVFMTHTLDGANTIWTHVGTDVIGYALTKMIQARESDGKIVVGTHGRGLFAGYLSEPGTVSNEGVRPECRDFKLYPNPSNQEVQLSFRLDASRPLTVEIFDLQGNVMMRQSPKNYSAGINEINVSINALPQGVFLLGLRDKAAISFKKLVKY